MQYFRETVVKSNEWRILDSSMVPWAAESHGS
jgi:hypothetical protein